MPPLPVVSSTIRFNLVFEEGTDTNVTSRLFFSYTGGPPSEADLTAFCGTLFTAVGANIMPQASNSVALIAVNAEDLGSTSDLVGVHSGSVAGTGGTAILPSGACALINHTIKRKYRGGKPRNYIPMGTGGDLTNPGAWASTAVTAMTTAFNNTVSALVGTTQGTTTISGHVNVSYYGQPYIAYTSSTGRTKYKLTLKTGPITPDAILTSACNPKPGSQRRRYQR